MADVDYLIVGNGVAGITAAQEIRYADAGGRILIVADEGKPYYYRASLSGWISGQTTDEMLSGRTSEFYDEMDIEQMTGHVTRVDAGAKQVHLASGDTLKYDKLLIATGARANVYPVEGLAETDVLVFRDLSDSREIKERLDCCGRALIVGGGILGLELAGALHKMDVQHVTIVQRTPPLGKPLLDTQAAEWLQERMVADGIDLFINDTVTWVEGQTAHFQSGRTWDFDIFVQAIGITPVFPNVPGLTTNKGIRTDDRCQTNLPNVYAAGDCTKTRVPGTDHWQTTRIWLDCAQQGRTAGRIWQAKTPRCLTDLSSTPLSSTPLSTPTSASRTAREVRCTSGRETAAIARSASWTADWPGRCCWTSGTAVWRCSRPSVSRWHSSVPISRALIFHTTI